LESTKIKKGDFIELDYTGKIKDGAVVFDTTIEKIAKDNNLDQKNAVYKPITVCIGEGHLIKGLDEGLVGKSVGKHEFDVEPDNGFGRKKAELLKLVPMKIFRQQNITPFSGLEVNVDGMFGIIRTASGGRVIVDFNHPLSSRDLVYDVDVKKIIIDLKEQVEVVLELGGIAFELVSVTGTKAVIKTKQDLSAEIKNNIQKEVIRLTKVKDLVVEKKTVEKKVSSPEEKS